MLTRERDMSTDKSRGNTAPELPPNRLRPLGLRPLGSPSYPLPSPLSRWLGAAGGFWLGGVLLVAVWAKALDPTAFAQQIKGEGLDRLLPAATLALLALALEAGLGLALVLGVRRLWVLLPAMLLVGFFLFLTGRTYWLAAHGQAPPEGSCGCFGNLVQRTPAEAFWQDLALLVPALVLAFRGRDRNQRALPPVRSALVLLASIAVPIFAWRAPELPLDDLATRLKPGVRLSGLCAAGGSVCLDAVAPKLGSGNHLVVLDDLGDDALVKDVAALNAYQARPGAAAVTVLTPSDAAHQRAFFWRWAPSFEIVEAPAELLRPLYRRLPRSFAVQDGLVTATFSGLPPLPVAPPAAASGPHASAIMTGAPAAAIARAAGAGILLNLSARLNR
jgi:uncharacterized membrane protein YphA (DoxX/SURF4 family)